MRLDPLPPPWISKPGPFSSGLLSRKIAYVQRDLSVSRPTATGYLEQLADKGFLIKRKAGRHNYYINEPLVECLVDPTEFDGTREAT